MRHKIHLVSSVRDCYQPSDPDATRHLRPEKTYYGKLRCSIMSYVCLLN